VKEALEKYGTARKLSLLVNEKLRESIPKKVEKKRMTIKLGKRLTEKEMEKIIEKGWEEAVKWRE
jgi:uncharacterized OsmC-like protein